MAPNNFEPEYRIRIEIRDATHDVVVSSFEQPLYSSEEDNAVAMFRAMRDFTGTKSRHEETFYPKEKND